MAPSPAAMRPVPDVVRMSSSMRFVPAIWFARQTKPAVRDVQSAGVAPVTSANSASGSSTVKDTALTATGFVSETGTSTVVKPGAPQAFPTDSVVMVGSVVVDDVLVVLVELVTVVLVTVVTVVLVTIVTVVLVTVVTVVLDVDVLLVVVDVVEASVVDVDVVVTTVVVVVGAEHVPSVPITSAPPGGPLFVGVGHASSKSLLAFVTRVRLRTPSPGIALVGAAAPTRCGPL